MKEWMDRLRNASKDSAVLVEGKRDKRALQKYGIKNIITLEGKRFTELPDLLEGFSRVILLFDLDKHGERIKEKVKEILTKQGYILIEEFREELRHMGINFVEDIDGKSGCVERTSDTGQAHKV
ncbi:MAG: toprim domain-containing protein [Aquificaceae bacterium]|nr:toprim domain-containing protein [Aquificaceae bacterium]MCS7278347.1 toprim domain-containing protein [Aquificaceae bacterium]MDW8423658.1 toprim domain-containing protein [Aquificaceae bacterium]